MDTDYVPVGTPLIEQDAEYLKDLIAAHGIPCRIGENHDHELAEIGRSSVVMVQRMHRQWALEIRSNEFAEPGTDGDKPMETMEETARRRPVLRTVFLGIAGAMMGMRVGVKLRGGAWGTLLVGGAMGILAMIASVMYSAERKVSTEDTQISESEDKSKD